MSQVYVAGQIYNGLKSKKENYDQLVDHVSSLNLEGELYSFVNLNIYTQTFIGIVLDEKVTLSAPLHLIEISISSRS